MSPRSVGAITVSLAVLLGAGAGSSACYGPTEVRLAVTTTASCAAGIETQIFTGVKGEGDFGTPLAASAAETNECGSQEPRIGTLTIVPSDARDGRFDLEVVAGVGVQAAACRTPVGAPKCIFVRRRVGFRPHHAVNLPILLSDRCIGVVCSDDKTCDLGTCAPLTDCSESGCPRERGDIDAGSGDAGDAGDAGDGANDASVPDAHPDAPVATACGLTPEVVVDGESIVGQLALQGNDFVYANVTSGGSEIRRVVRTGGLPRTARPVAGLAAVAVGPPGLAWAANVGGTMEIAHEVGAMTLTVYGPTYSTEALAFSGAKNVLVGVALSAAAGGRGFAGNTGLVFDTMSASLSSAATEVVVDTNGEWMGVAGATVVRYHVITGDNPELLGTIANRGPRPDIALVNHTLYVALGNGPAGTGLYGIPRTQIALAAPYVGTPIVSGVLSDSIAADDSGVYYIDAGKLWRKIPGNPALPTMITAVPAASSRLFVDGTCVYWIENGTRIMRHAK